jgi:hypothetical protein
LLRAGSEPLHLLPSFAATYPVDFFSLLDCAMHSSTTQPDKMAADEVAAAINMLHAGIIAGNQSPALLQQPGAVVSLAGAVTSIIKAWKLQCAELAADSAGTHRAEAVSASAGLQLAVLQRMLPVVRMLQCLADALFALLSQAAAGPSAPGVSGSNSSSGSFNSTSSGSGGAGDAQQTSGDCTEQQQQTATKVLLAVFLARSVVALADAAAPSAGLRVVLQDATAGYGSSSSSSADMQQAANGAEAVDELAGALDDWQAMPVIGIVVDISGAVLSTCQLLGLGTQELPSSSCGSNNSSDTSGRVRWAYLLQLARSKKLATAFGEMTSVALFCKEVVSSTDAMADSDSEAATAAAAHSLQQLMNKTYGAVLQIYRVLAVAAPLPHLCNNLGCSSLAAGSTEAAAAVKVCSGCGAWYRSAGCAAAHLRQHMKACGRMAALGLNVSV